MAGCLVVKVKASAANNGEKQRGLETSGTSKQGGRGLLSGCLWLWLSEIKSAWYIFYIIEMF